MELRNLAVFLVLCLMAVSQCSEARHSIERRDANDEDIFANDAASEDEGTQNDEDFDVSGGNTEVKDQPMIRATITTSPTTYEVNVSSDVILECKVDPDVGTVVQWYKGDHLYFVNTMDVAGNGRYNIVNNSRDLNISQVEPSDAGVYRCVVPLEPDNISIKHTVVVLTSPVITRFSATNDGNVIEGENLLLTCDVSGKPPPQIVWSKAGDNGNYRLGEQDGEFSSNSVFMKNVKREHSGKYYCYAFNSLGNNQSELFVSVIGKPHVRVHKTVVNSAVNVEAELQCSIHYEANPHIRWYKDGALIADSSSQYIVSTHGTHSNLTVTPTNDADFGTFTCEASNSIGKHNRSIELVQRPVVEDFETEENGRLSWNIHSHQPLQEIRLLVHPLGENVNEWKEFEIPLPHSLLHKYQLTFDLGDKLTEAGKYEALVKVKNDHSWSDNVDPVIFDIDNQPQPIQHASVFGSDGFSIRPSSIVLSTTLMYVLVRLL